MYISMLDVRIYMFVRRVRIYTYIYRYINIYTRYIVRSELTVFFVHKNDVLLRKDDYNIYLVLLLVRNAIVHNM